MEPKYSRRTKGNGWMSAKERFQEREKATGKSSSPNVNG